MGFKKRARANRPPKPKKSKSCLCKSLKNTKSNLQCCSPLKPDGKVSIEQSA